MVHLIFTAVLLFATPAHAIIGGVQTQPEIHESMVNILFENGRCTGTLISSNTVLTAAHCRDRFGEPLNVVVSNVSATPACGVKEVIDFEYEPSAQPTLPLNVHDRDLLLVQIKAPLCGATPAKLAQRDFKTNEQVWSAGHGQGNIELGQTDQVALEITGAQPTTEEVEIMDYLSRRIFNEAQETYLYSTALIPGTGFCHGDSGGPVFVVKNNKMHVLGVNGAMLPDQELGAKECGFAYYFLVAPLFPHLDWVRSTIKKWQVN